MTKHDDLHIAEAAAQSEYDALLASYTATTSQLASSQAALTKAQADLKACQDATKPPPADNFQNVPVGADLNAVMKQAGPGAKLQLPATLKAGTLKPYPGQHLRGPCVITPSSNGLDYGMILQGNDATNVTLEKLDMSGYGRRAVTAWYGCHIIGGHYHHNGEMGFGFDGKGAKQDAMVVDGAEIDHNGFAKDASGTYLWAGHGASGAKWFTVWKTEVKNCNIHDNLGNGLWWDFNSGDAIITNNSITASTRKGIFYEKCGGSIGLEGRPAWDAENGLVVTGNTIRNNGSENKEPYAGVGINTSKHAFIDNNTFGNVGAKVGIYIREDPDRLIPASWGGKIGFKLSDIVVGKNNTMNGDKVVGCGQPGVTC